MFKKCLSFKCLKGTKVTSQDEDHYNTDQQEKFAFFSNWLKQHDE